MKYPVYMTREEAKQLEYEVVSEELKIYFTRILTNGVENTKNEEVSLVRKNKLVNKARTIAGKSIYILESDQDGYYMPQEYGWHNGEMALLFRRLSTPQFADFVAELTENNHLNIEEVNELLTKDGVSFRLEKTNDSVSVKVIGLEDIISSDLTEETHPNIRLLVSRMENALGNNDYAGVLHSSASIFETLAKIVVNKPTVQNQTLKSFFDRYRKDSNLPKEILDYILDVYDRRNITPLAGHGSTIIPTITKEQAIILSEMTKAFVKIEYKLTIEDD